MKTRLRQPGTLRECDGSLPIRVHLHSGRIGIRSSAVPSLRRGFHRGQSLVLALGVMFLMVFTGAIFVSMVARNLARVERTGDTTQARFLAEAAIRYADQQLTFSDQGADWRPLPQWPSPAENDPEARKRRETEVDRQRHPDYLWLSDSGGYERPWASFDTGEGRFLLRVTYEPTFRRGTRESPAPDEFDTLSGYLHIEAIGRPGIVDLNDPTTMLTPENPNYRPGNVLGPYVYLQAYKPIGLTDQLWWVTNRTKQRGPAEMGVPPYEDGTGKWVNYDNDYYGGIRSNVDLDWLGNTSIYLHPLHGDAVTVAGLINHASTGNNPLPRVQVHLVNSQGQPLFPPVEEGPSDSAQFNVLLLPGRDTGRVHYADNRWFETTSVHPGRAIRYLEPPRIDATDPTTNENRYRRMTRDSGAWRRVTLGGETQTVNLGWYGLGQGLYLDNFTDIQYESDRDTVVDEWLRRGSGEVAHTGWAGGFYTPSVRDSGTTHPVTEIELLPEGIRMTRADRDVRGRNFGDDNRFKTRIFYAYNANTGGLEPRGAANLFPYPENGVIFAEGSIRIRGLVGRRKNGQDPPNAPETLPVNLTIACGGTIFIEGSLIKTHPASGLALLAKDYVCLNPTQFLQVTPGEDVTIVQDSTGPDVQEFHYNVPQDKDVELTFQWADPPLPNNAESGVLLHLQHSGGFEDQLSRTDVALYINGSDEGNRYDFSAYPPPYPSQGTASGAGRPYSFFFFPPGQTPNWWQSNAQSSTGGTVNWERKSFWIPAERLNTQPGALNSFRLHVEATPGGQPYWLSRASITPYRNGQPEPLSVRVQAMVYAQNGSWFVIPTPWANENTQDLRDQFALGDPQTNRAALVRAPGTFPADTEDYPFFHEPLNMQVTLQGAITENMPAVGTERARWVQRQWMDAKAYGQSDYQVPAWFRPGLRYEYDDSMRFWVRFRNLVTGAEGFAYAGPPGEAPSGVARLDQVRAQALAAGQNVVALPLFPRLTAGSLFYAGNPL